MNRAQAVPAAGPDYERVRGGVIQLLEDARRGAARAVNSILAATYWEIGRRIVQFELGGKARAGYGEALLVRLGADLSARYGRGFSWRNLFRMRNFYVGWEILPTPSAKFEAHVRLPNEGDSDGDKICPTPSGESRTATLSTQSAKSHACHSLQTVSAKTDPAMDVAQLETAFPLSWSHR
jgi:hypothetical protein